MEKKKKEFGNAKKNLAIDRKAKTLFLNVFLSVLDLHQIWKLSINLYFHPTCKITKDLVIKTTREVHHTN